MPELQSHPCIPPPQNPTVALNTRADSRIHTLRTEQPRPTEPASPMESTHAGDDNTALSSISAFASVDRLDESARQNLVRLAYRLLWNRDDAEDAVQDALTSAHEKRDELREKDKWFAWVRQILVQRCRAVGRRKVLWNRFRTSEPVRDAELPIAGKHDDRIAAVNRTRELLMRLPERQRQVIVLRFLEGLDYDEIATLLDVTPSTCRVHAYAGLESMRTTAKRQFPNFAQEIGE